MKLSILISTLLASALLVACASQTIELPPKELISAPDATKLDRARYVLGYANATAQMRSSKSKRQRLVNETMRSIELIGQQDGLHYEGAVLFNLLRDKSKAKSSIVSRAAETTAKLNPEYMAVLYEQSAYMPNETEGIFQSDLIGAIEKWERRVQDASQRGDLFACMVIVPNPPGKRTYRTLRGEFQYSLNALNECGSHPEPLAGAFAATLDVLQSEIRWHEQHQLSRQFAAPPRSPFPIGSRVCYNDGTLRFIGVVHSVMGSGVYVKISETITPQGRRSTVNSGRLMPATAQYLRNC